MNIHNRQSIKQVFFSLEFENILLQMEAKAVKMRRQFFNSAVIANSKMDCCKASKGILSLKLAFGPTLFYYADGQEGRYIKPRNSVL